MAIKPPLYDLPADNWLNVCRRVSVKDRGSLACTSKKFYVFINTEFPNDGRFSVIKDRLPKLGSMQPNCYLQDSKVIVFLNTQKIRLVHVPTKKHSEWESPQEHMLSNVLDLGKNYFLLDQMPHYDFFYMSNSLEPMSYPQSDLSIRETDEPAQNSSNLSSEASFTINSVMNLDSSASIELGNQFSNTSQRILAADRPNGKVACLCKNTINIRNREGLILFSLTKKCHYSPVSALFEDQRLAIIYSFVSEERLFHELVLYSFSDDQIARQAPFRFPFWDPKENYMVNISVDLKNNKVLFATLRNKTNDMSFLVLDILSRDTWEFPADKIENSLQVENRSHMFTYPGMIHNNRYIHLGSKALHLFDLFTGQECFSIPIAPHTQRSLFDISGQTIAIATDSSVTLYHFQTGEKLCSFPLSTPPQEILFAAESKENAHLIVLLKDGQTLFFYPQNAK